MELRPRTFLLVVFAIFFLSFNINAQKNQDLTEEELKIWWQKDIIEDTIPGISLDRAYRELLQNKKGEEVIVAVLDTKIDVNHEDIKGQLWINIDEIPNNNIDDDNNGYIDDINGWNFLGNAKGEDVVKQHSEATRILKRYKEKYDSVEVKNLSPPEKKNHSLYLHAKKKYVAEVAQIRNDLSYWDSVSVVFRRAKDTVTYMLSRSNHSMFEVDSLAKIKTDMESDLNYYSRMIGYEVTEERYKVIVDMFSNDLSMVYGLDYDERAILNDDPHSFSDVPYGNNILVNNELYFQHSTPVSGLMAATRDNKIGVNGISNSIKIMPVVMVAEGDENDKEVALAIRYAVDNGADIINMSWGKYLSLHVDWVREAFKYAEDNDVLLVSGSGNDAKNTDIELNYPNDNIDGAEFVDNFIMAGGHINKMDSTLIASFSNYGKNTVDIFAPADDIYAPDIENSYQFTGGTSFASPLVSGTAAVVKSYFPNLTAVQLKEIILESGTEINLMVKRPGDEDSAPLVPFSSLSKTGKMLNAYNALKLAEQISKKLD